MEKENAGNRLSSEEQFFLKVMGDYLNGTKSVLPGSLDWKTLNNIAWKHEAAGILYYQLKRMLDGSDITANQKTWLFKSYGNASMKYVKRVKFLDEIDQAFNDCGIRYLIFKGVEIAKLYPNPKLRTMGDSDLLIRGEDNDRAHECLLKLGWEADSTEENEWKYHREDIHLELHREMMNDEAADTEEQTAFYEKCWDCVETEKDSVRCRFNWNYHFVYVVTHLRKHLIGTGVGFRQFMDVAVIAEKCSLDWEWIRNELTAMKMWEFAVSCFAFCERWFGVKFPVPVREISEDFYLEATERIFNGGVFGMEDERNLSNYDILKMRKSRGMRKTERFRAALAFFFPSYGELRIRPPYTFVDRKPWLVPAAWIFRAGRFLTGRSSCNAKRIGEQHHSRNAFLDQWGIKD